MYLFDRNDENISVYSMKANLEKITAYRKSQTINCQKVYKAISNDKKAPFVWENLKGRPFTDFSLDDVCYKKRGLARNSHDVIEIDYDRCPEIYGINPISSYCTGGYDCASLVRIYKENEDLKQLEFVRYLLINSDYIYESEHSRSKFIEKIVGITEEAFLLELLKRGHFAAIGNADISEQINLFDFSKEPIVSVSEKEYFYFEIGGMLKKNEYAETLITDSQKVLKYARMQGLINK